MDPEKRAHGGGPDEYLRGQRRIALLFAVRSRALAAQPPGAPDEVSVRVMRAVARHAEARHDFERHRKRLADSGRPFELPELFDLIADELPGWCPWLEEVHDSGAASSHGARAALNRLVSHGQTQAEKGQRFTELALLAARLTGSGSLGRAASAVAEAERLIGQAAAPPESIQAARAGAFDGFRPDVLQPFVGPPGSRASLGRVLGFFRALQPVALLQEVAVEVKRERRHLILALLEAHGPAARREALELLRADPEPDMADDEAFLRRNLIYLLRRVPRQGEDGLDEEIAVLARHAAPGYAPMVVKEAIGAVAQYPGRRAEQALAAIRERMQAAPAGGAGRRPRPDDLRVYLDRLASALSRRGTSPRAPARPSAAVATTQKFGLAADGLPCLLCELAENRASGALSLEETGGAAAAALAFSEGRLVSARSGALSGVDAVYQALQVFGGGDATWAPSGPSGSTPLFETDALALGPVVVEGLRRRDERELARAFAPDGAVLAASKSAPQPHLDEKDGLVTRDVWAAATGGRSPLEIEKALPVEAFRVRRLLLHWIEEGALQEVFSVPRPTGA
jgi:hypothetical protein